MKFIRYWIISWCFANTVNCFADALPEGFVYLSDVAPIIQQEMGYAGNHNFVGRPIRGYAFPTCILTSNTAKALQRIQEDLSKKNLSLKVYDCYRPTRAVDDFIEWSQQPDDQLMKQEFYPRIDKQNVFKLGYVASCSGHSRGSTVDLTIIRAHAKPSAIYVPGQALVSCFAPYNKRFKDNSLDMGTGYDCLDSTAYPGDKTVDSVAIANRLLLRKMMMQAGFEPYEKEWWHFTFKEEMYPDTYFNFLIREKTKS